MTKLSTYANRISKIRLAIEADLEALQDEMQRLGEEGEPWEHMEDLETKLQDILSILEDAEMECAE